MRKRSALCVLLLILLCSGCARIQPGPSPSPLAAHAGSYEAEAEIRCGKLTATAAVSRPSPDECTVTLTAPESLEGMVFAFRAGQVEVSYRELALPYAPGGLPPTAAPGLLVDALNHAMLDVDVLVRPLESGTELTGTPDSGAYTLLLDAESGCPRKLSVPGADLEIEFVSFTFLD